MSKFTDAEIRATIEAAFEKAALATQNFLAINGDRDACGFAWVNVAPGTSKVARILKEYGGRKAYGAKGIQVWNPSKSYTQAITAKEVGADAFAQVLKAKFPELEVYAGSRMD